MNSVIWIKKEGDVPVLRLWQNDDLILSIFAERGELHGYASINNVAGRVNEDGRVNNFITCSLTDYGMKNALSHLLRGFDFSAKCETERAA